MSHHTPGTPLDLASTPPTQALFADDPALLAMLSGAVARACCPPSTPSRWRPSAASTTTRRTPTSSSTGLGNVVVGCGTSGHGFKFGPLLGELLADLAEGTKPEPYRGPFSLHREPGAGNRPPPDAR